MSEPHLQLRKQPLNSLSTKIIFFVFLSTFLTALVVSWISIQSTHTYLRGQIDESFPPLLARSSQGLQDWVEMAGQAATVWSVDSRIREALRRPPARRTPGRRPRRATPDPAETLPPLLQHLIERSPYFDALTTVDAEGAPVAHAGAGPPATLSPWPEGESPDLDVVRQIHVDRGGVAHPALVVTVFSDLGTPLGFLIASLHRGALDGLLLETKYEAPGELFVVDRHGRVVAGPPGDGQTPRVPLDRLLDGSPASVQEYTSTMGTHVLGSAVPLALFDWVVVIEEPFEVAFEPVLSVVTRIFVSDLCIILFFSFLAYKITTAIVHPIEALSEGARRVSLGQSDYVIPDPKSNDEIALLTRTFNDMVRKLARNQREIEAANQQLSEQNDQLHQANEVLEQLSITDGLTKLHNHRFFQDHLTREIKRCSRTHEPLSLLLMDIDDFKRLNDRLGHAAGDELLVRIARIMEHSIRDSDLLARYGGEEFVVVATGTDLAGAVNLAEKIRTAVNEVSHILEDSMRPTRISISTGVAQYRGNRKEFFQAADRALYRAKAEGKNCVVAAEEDDP
ncbi:MAG: diguanylate cyclase [Proteobacteria bacterium]|nr:diguanylate cyclase [Pseudomonadota bacterium]